MSSATRLLSSLLATLLLSATTTASADCPYVKVVDGVKVDDRWSFPSPTYTSPYWSVTAIYNQGDIVQRDGHQYQARWWTQGDTPLSDKGEAWQMTTGFNGKPQKWEAGQVYQAGETTDYKNRLYTARWWTKGEAPDASSAWAAGNILDPLVQVKLRGSWKRESCRTQTPQGDVWEPTTYTTTWAITEGQSAVAYWKIMEEDAVRPESMWVEIQRGTGTSGTLVFRDTGIWKKNMVHLCTAANVCRRVVASDGDF